MQILAALAAALSVAGAAEPGDTAPSLVDVMRERILAQLALKPGMKVGEIGVGGGWFVVRIAQTVGPDGIVYGTDIDAETIAGLQQKLPSLRPGAARVDLRLCRDGRDTALDDLPDGRLDLITMIDSLCFDAHEPRQRNVAYLSRFLRVLRPGGRLVHHMDCRCDVSIDAVIAQFTAAGFSPQVETIDVSPDPAHIDADWPCRTEAERRRHAVLLAFRKPDPAGGGAAVPPPAGD
jgi:ubiquinone/menaquinone biosynthesis C-methylase UbiE